MDLLLHVCCVGVLFIGRIFSLRIFNALFLIILEASSIVLRKCPGRKFSSQFHVNLSYAILPLQQPSRDPTGGIDSL